jgi:hypothetical protein
VLLGGLRTLQPFWKPSATATRAQLPAGDLQELGWLGPARFALVAREVVVRDILDPLETIGIAITKEQRAELLG